MKITHWKAALLLGLSACSRGSGTQNHDGAADTRPPELDGQGGQSMDVEAGEKDAAVEDSGAGWDGEAGSPAEGDGGEIGDASTEPACRTDKLAFSQGTGCRNDNAVEFCLPANDTNAVSQAKDIAPTVRCSLGPGGRAGCKPATEQLCLLHIPREQCPMEGPMPDDLWLSVCRLAALDVVTRIVPTWYE